MFSDQTQSVDLEAPVAAEVTEASSSGPLRPLVRLLAWLGPDYTFFAVFLTLLVLLSAIFPVHFVWRTYTVELSALTAVGMIALRFLSRARAIVSDEAGARDEFRDATLRTLQDWGPLFLLALVFANLETYTGLLRQQVIDDILYSIDLKLFGVEPSVWLSSLDWPLLTDWMAVSYSLYIATPMVLATVLLLRGRRAHFQEMSTAVILQMYIAFVLFLLFPAGPPRFYPPLVNGSAGFAPPVLRSFLGIYEAQQAGFDKADPLRTRSAFPSLHCSLALFTLIFAWRHGDAIFPRRPRLFFVLCVPLVVSLWLSTVYLRHHWVPDIVAGLVLGTASCMLAPWLRRAWPKTA